MAYHYQIFENAIRSTVMFLLRKSIYKGRSRADQRDKKILGDDGFTYPCATAVRTPVNGGHSESVNVELTVLSN
ncbi:MAG: hypothetical protein IPO48_20280 [Saprospiraceae bacterium]|nr:hypothetical protein [Saprospiraceae bacterium]